MESVTLSDTLDYTSLSDVYASPHGRNIIYKTHRPILEKNGYDHRAWIKSEENITEILYYSGNIVWESDEVFYFAVAEDEHRTCFYKKKVGGALEKQFEIGYSAVLLDRTSKNGYIYIITTNIEEKKKLEHTPVEHWQDVYAEFVQRDEDCIIADEFPYWSDERGIINKVRSILYLYENGQSKQLTDDYFNVRKAVYNPEDHSLWYTGGSFTVQAPLKSGLYRIDLENLEKKEYLPVGSASISEIGIWNSKVVFLSGPIGTQEAKGAENIYTIQDGKAIRLTDTELSFGTSVFSDVVYGGGTKFLTTRDKVYFIATYEETANIWSLDTRGNIVRETLGNHVIHSFSVTDEGIYWIGLSDLKHQELYVTAQNTKQLTTYNSKYDNKQLSIPETLSFTDQYGNIIVGWVLRPVGQIPGRKYPGILDIHGGPRGAYGAVYFHEMQYWAAKGYFVLYANPSGGTGRGIAFQKVHGGLGSGDYENLMEFVDRALEKYQDIDAARLGVTGGSYGGFMTNWIIGHTDRFAAAVSQRSTANNITEAAGKDIAPGFIRSYTDPQAEDRFDRLWDGSPLRFIGKNVVTPTLFLHSLNDYRCYHVESMQMYAALQYFHIPTRMVLFKNEHHGLSRDGHPRNRIRRLKEITDWMDDYLKEESGE